MNGSTVVRAIAVVCFASSALAGSIPGKLTVVDSAGKPPGAVLGDNPYNNATSRIVRRENGVTFAFNVGRLGFNNSDVSVLLYHETADVQGHATSRLDLRCHRRPRCGLESATTRQ